MPGVDAERDATGDDEVTASAGTDAAGTPRPLVLRPFRGVRFSPDAVTDLARVTSPPYDVVDSAGVVSLESTDPHNVVRLILPRSEDCGPEGRYEHAASTLRSWLADGVLRVDALAGLYVYEQSVAGSVLQRGLLGALELRDPSEGVVLPHEDVMPGPVQDRLELMRAAGANVEPILLVYPGDGGPAAQVIARTAALDPLLEATTDDQITHRLWEVVAADDLAAVAADLAGRQALIADGHHRYAAYRRLQAERAGTGPGPWDAGLALLVDTDAYPLHVGAIHRAVRGLELDEAVKLATDRLFTAEQLGGAAEVTDTAGRLTAGQMLLVGADGRLVRLTVADPAGVDALVPREHVERWRSLDTAVLHHVLIEHVWEAADDRVSYHHDVAGAVRAARAEDGTAVLLAPVTVDTVFALAAAGERMPRKSTSFGPKPRTGIVLRTFGDD